MVYQSPIVNSNLTAEFRAKRRIYEKTYRDKNKDKVSAMMKVARARWAAKDPIRAHVTQVINRAKKRYEFSLPKELVKDLITDVCMYCGAVPAPYNTMDRVDNLKGYVEGNVVTACRPCNVAKNAWSVSEFAGRLERMIKKFPDWRKALGV